MLENKSDKSGKYEMREKALRHKNKKVSKSTKSKMPKLETDAASKHHQGIIFPIATYAYNHGKYLHVQKGRRTKRNQLASPFLRLPGEIRNMIYGHVLRAAGGAYFFNRTAGLRAQLREETPDPTRLALLGVCRQIYQETASLPFQLNIFQVDSLYAFSLLTDSLTSFQRCSIKKLQVGIDFKSCYEVADFLADIKEHEMTFAMLYPRVRHLDVWSHGIRIEDPDWKQGLSGPTLKRIHNLEKWVTA